ncbi:MAG: hypothetical protein FJ267_18620, partial [Planctomycetes bacterium]|nr:hypothetical protein [Planctomycetota bacterium]
MERLAPIIKQRFWILLGIGILMPIIGWWMDTGSLAATISSRKTAIEAAKKKVPTDLKKPNDEWTAKLSVINAKQDEAVKAAASLLWIRQREVMEWPETVVEYAWKNGYRGNIDVDGRVIYLNSYIDGVRRVWNTVRPLKNDGTGIVKFGFEGMEPKAWPPNLPPLAADMWDAQEDLWLQKGLLQTIADFNGGENATRLDASIHVIEQLKLVGGQPAASRNAGLITASAVPASGGGKGLAIGNPDDDDRGGPSIQRFSAPTGTVVADFDFTEEFGGSVIPGAQGTPGRGSGNNPDVDDDRSLGGGPVVKGRRYLDD